MNEESNSASIEENMSVIEKARGIFKNYFDTKTYDYSNLIKRTTWFLPFGILLLPVFIDWLSKHHKIPIDIESMPAEAIWVFFGFMFILFSVSVFLIIKNRKPSLEISVDGIKCNQAPFETSKSVSWNLIQYMAIEKYIAPLQKDMSKPLIVIRVFYHERHSNTSEQLVIRPHLLKNGNEAVSFLKQIIPVRDSTTSSPIQSSLDQAVDPVVAVLIISGGLLVIVDVIILVFYPPTIASTWTYPLLLIPLGLVPFLYTVMLLASNNSVIQKNRPKKIIAALSFNMGLLVAIFILFYQSPSSYSWMLADVNAMSGDLDTAEYYYKKAEPALAPNADFLFAFAQMYSIKNDWDNASRYYILSYEKDPTNWMTETLVKIPESLHKAKKTTEALEWCDKIKKSYSHRKDVIREMDRIRKKIE